MGKAAGAEQKKDRTASLTVSSSAPEIVAVEGAAVVGVKPGEATVKARIPGVPPIEVLYSVVDKEFTSLVVEPTRSTCKQDNEVSLPSMPWGRRAARLWPIIRT